MLLITKKISHPNDLIYGTSSNILVIQNFLGSPVKNHIIRSHINVLCTVIWLFFCNILPGCYLNLYVHRPH